MEIKEFRIGNFVYDRGNKVLKIDSIQCIGDGYHKIEMQQYIGNMLVHPLTEYNDYLKPIPITEEWLLKFSFENWGLKKVNEYEHETTYALYNSLGGTSTFKVVLIDSSYGTIPHKEWRVRIDHETVDVNRMEFVHDLQNAFYLLSGYELSLSAVGKV